MTDHQMLVFGSFTEDEIRSIQCQPPKNDIEITFGSFDSETLKSVGFFNTKVTEPHLPSAYELSKTASAPNVFRLSKSNESTSVSEVAFLGENGCFSSTFSGDGGAKELKPGCIEKPSSGGSSDHRVSELSSSLEEDVLDDSENGVHQVESKESTFKKSNWPNRIPRNFLPRGLVNLGNLCFLNATLQALLSCSPFFELLHELRNRDIPEIGYPTLRAFVDFISDFDVVTDSIGKSNEKTVVETGSPFRPTMFDSVLKSFTPDIPDNILGRPRQEDAQEFLSFVMHQMHDELLKLDGQASNGNGKTASLVSSTNYEGEDDNWETVGPRNKTAITRTQNFVPSKLSAIFGGQLKSVVKPKGNKASANIEPFLVLHLNISPEPVCSVEDALRLFSAPETLDGYRAGIGKAEVVIASKSVKILELSELVVGREFLASPSAEGRRYELVATITHHGGDPSKGHYTADARHPTGTWLRYDDASVKRIHESEVQHDQAYVLFYKQL